MSKPLICAALIFAAAIEALAAERPKRIVIYEGVATEVGPGPNPPVTTALPAQSVRAAESPGSVELPDLVDSRDLWITLKDLTRATKFTLKPQGMCRDELCIPIPKDRKRDFVSKQGGVTWFNLTEFARLLHQPVAYDEKHATWLFVTSSQAKAGYGLSSVEAPNFSLPDMSGKLHSLSDFRGKKVLLITWASW